MGEDGRRAAKGYRKIGGQVLSLGFERWRQAVQNQVGIELADNAYFKTLHPTVSSS